MPRQLWVYADEMKYIEMHKNGKVTRQNQMPSVAVFGAGNTRLA